METECVVTVSYHPSPDFGTSSSGCGREVRSWIGWTPMEKTAWSAVWLFFPCNGRLGKARIVPYSVVGTSHFLRVFARIRLGKAQLSCPDGEGSLCWLDRGDVLIMDVQCLDEFLHCTDPGLEHRHGLNITFRWVKQHVASCPQGSSVSITEFVRTGTFWGFWVLLGVLFTGRGTIFAGLPSCAWGLGFAGCAYRWTRSLDGGRRGHHLRSLLGVHLVPLKMRLY